MGKLITVLSFFILFGCVQNPPKVEIVKEKYPVMYVPAPPVVKRPNLTVQTLTTDEQKDIGIVSKAFADDLIILQRYVSILEKIINKYEELSKSNPSFQEFSIDEINKLEKIKKYFQELIGNDKID